MAGIEETKATLREQIEGDDLVQRLAEKMGASARASAVFGEPIEREGVTVIPVARSRWGFGGGSGTQAGEQGGGGGGGSMVSPIGYIEVRASGAEFKPIRDPRLIGVAVGATLGLAALAVRARARR